jgi:DNA invertase Pin-like site-specific DNA recombinase
MLNRIAEGEADGIIAWHPDRLARNAVDSGAIINLLDSGPLLDLRFPTHSFEPTPQGKFVLGLAFSQSKYYIDSLAENSKRGVREKVRRGDYPGFAPFGYLNDPRIKRIVVDTKHARLIKIAFKEYAGGATLLDVSRIFANHGVITKPTNRHPGGRPMSRSAISKILRNPIYYGEFRFGGMLHPGNHTPLVAKRVYDAAQRMFADRLRWSRKTVKRIPKTYVGLLRCGECGCSITAEIQKGHTYYRCTRKSKTRVCAEPYAREEALHAQLMAIVSPYHMPEKIGHALLKMSEHDEEASRIATASELALLRAEVKEIDEKIAMLQEDRLDGLVERESFVSKHFELRSRRKTLDEHSRRLLTNQNVWLEPLTRWISDATNLTETMNNGSRKERCSLLQKIFGSNLNLKGRIARGEAVKPWSDFADNGLSSQTACLYNAARTFFMRPRTPDPPRTSKFQRKHRLG